MTALLAGFIIPTLQMTKLRLEGREETCARPGAGNWIRTPVCCPQIWSLTRTVSASTTPLGGISRNQWAGTRAGSVQNGSGLSPGRTRPLPAAISGVKTSAGRFPPRPHPPLQPPGPPVHSPALTSQRRIVHSASQAEKKAETSASLICFRNKWG